MRDASDQNVKPVAKQVAAEAEPRAKELTDKQVCSLAGSLAGRDLALLVSVCSDMLAARQQQDQRMPC